MNKIKVDIISGFLGSGKTMLINQMLKTVYSDMKIAIVENEFGDESIDSALFSNELEITELTNGCVCCTLRIDLVKGINELYEMNRFDRIVIEPSGVSKLSDMKYIFSDESLMDKIEKGVCITIINPKVHEDFSKNFGQFYNDQIENADALYISRNDMISESQKLDVLVDLKIRNDGQIFEQLPLDILKLTSDAHGCGGCGHDHDASSDGGCGGHDGQSGGGCGGHSDDDEGGCGGCGGHDHDHDGDADETFFSHTLEYEAFDDEREIEDTVGRIIKYATGQVLRIKGFLSAEGRSYLVQWAGDELKITPSDIVKDKLIVIEAKK